VRDAVRGSAVSTWPRRRKREATTKRQAHAGRQGKGLIMRIKFESCLGLGRAGRGEVGQPSRALQTVVGSRKRLAGAYSNRDKGQARTATGRARVARLQTVRSAQARTVSSVVWDMYLGTTASKHGNVLHIHSTALVIRNQDSLHLLFQLPRRPVAQHFAACLPACVIVDVVVRTDDTSSYLTFQRWHLTHARFRTAPHFTARHRTQSVVPVLHMWGRREN